MARTVEQFTSNRKLSVDDFEQVARDLGLAIQTARKKGLVAALTATADTPIVTLWNGEETRNVARTGDLIVTALDATGAPLIDGAGNKNVHVIEKPRFADLYEPVGRDSSDGPIHRAVGVVRFLRLERGFEIIAPWGERQVAESGYLLANGEDVYGNNAETFQKTYEILLVYVRERGLMKTRDEHLFGPGPKRILSLDGGGVRGLISLGILARVEALLRERVPEEQREAFRLCDYFDLIGGTSTGALIAVQLAMGESVKDITKRYEELCPKLFSRPRKLMYLRSRHDAGLLDAAIRSNLRELVAKYGHSPEIVPDLDTPILRTGIAVVTKRINTGSVWVQTNNPRHKRWDRTIPPWNAYWGKAEPDNKFFANRSYSLSKIVRASASAPFYFDPVALDIDSEQIGVFLDGGVSPFNDPSAELFMMTALAPAGNAGASLSPHGFSWKTGADNIFLLSVGAGTYRVKYSEKKYKKLSAAAQGFAALKGLIADSQKNTRTWMQAISVPPRLSPAVEVQHYLDSNLDSLSGLRLVDDPLLTYRRVDATIDQQWLLRYLNKTYSEPEVEELQELDCPKKDMHKRCLEIGLETGMQYVAADDFPKSFDLESWGNGGAGVQLFDIPVSTPLSETT